MEKDNSLWTDYDPTRHFTQVIVTQQNMLLYIESPFWNDSYLPRL